MLPDNNHHAAFRYSPVRRAATAWAKLACKTATVASIGALCAVAGVLLALEMHHVQLVLNVDVI